MIALPAPVKTAVSMLEAAGFSCHLVGGCVRDMLRGRSPQDYDLTTNALPPEMQQVFAQLPCIETGLKHGTLTVVIDRMPIEITTYRIDGTYSDARHPDGVVFSDRLEKDLARRDFTVNAMAWHPVSGLVDPFGGQRDLKSGVLRCVGRPQQRFSEDALRILRCLRFSSTLRFAITPETADALHTQCRLLNRIAPERIHAELDKLLLGKSVTAVLLEYPDVLGVPIPELLPSVGFEQHSPYHKYNVWDHTAHAVGQAAAFLPVRLTMLLHDFGKPAAYRPDSTGRGHFKQHAAIGAKIAAPLLERLRYDNRTVADITELIAHHGDKLTDKRQVRRALAVLGTEQFFRLIEVRRADTKSKQAFCLAELSDIDRAEAEAHEILADNECLTLHDLLIDGNDLLTLGAKGPGIGAILNDLLDRVLDGTLPNKREALFAAAEQQVRIHRKEQST